MKRASFALTRRPGQPALGSRYGSHERSYDGAAPVTLNAGSCRSPLNPNRPQFGVPHWRRSDWNEQPGRTETHGAAADHPGRGVACNARALRAGSRLRLRLG